VLIGRARRPVRLAAVELDDEPLGRPQGVDGVGADLLIGQRPVDAVGVKEREERDLERSSSRCGAMRQRSEERQGGPHSLVLGAPARTRASASGQRMRRSAPQS
jgi:hypothetical protein